MTSSKIEITTTITVDPTSAESLRKAQAWIDSAIEALPSDASIAVNQMQPTKSVKDALADAPASAQLVILATQHYGTSWFTLDELAQRTGVEKKSMMGWLRNLGRVKKHSGVTFFNVKSLGTGRNSYAVTDEVFDVMKYEIPDL